MSKLFWKMSCWERQFQGGGAGTGGMRRPQLVHHAQGLLGQVVGEVVAVGIVVDVDVVVVGAQPVGLVEVGEGVEDPVEAVEASLQGPAGLGGAVAEVGVFGQVPLADDERGPARAAEGLGDGHRVVAQLVGVAGEAGIGVGHGGHAGHVVVESGQQRGPGGRAHRVDVEVGVAQALGGQAVELGGVDLRAVTAQVGVAQVVGHHHDHVGRPRRRDRRLRPVGLGGGEDLADGALEARVRRGRVHGRWGRAL